MSAATASRLNELPARLRGDFPILGETANGRPLAYLDNAASSQKPIAVLRAMDSYYEHDNANVHRGLHVLSTRATQAYEGARERVTRFIDAERAEEIVFTRGTTESINLVAQAWCQTNLTPGSVILLTEMEHHSNLVPWQLAAKRHGATVRYVPVNGREGTLDPADVERMLTPEVKIFAFTYISNSLGTINPVREFCAMARERGITTLVDGAQAVGHIPLSVRGIGADFLAFSGHKMCGPTGIGVLYGRHALLSAMEPWQGGGEMIASVTYEGARWKPAPHRFEAGTPNMAGAVGLGAAIEYLSGIGLEVIQEHGEALIAYAIGRLSEVPGIEIIGPKGRRGALVSFTMADAHPHDLATFLDQEGIAVRAGHHCNQPLMRKLGLPSTARASFYFYNTTDEVDALVLALNKARQYFS